MQEQLIGTRRGFFEDATVGIVECDLVGAVRFANQAALDLFGLETYENSNLYEFYKNPSLLQRALDDRAQGLIGAYKAEILRPVDDESLVVDVTAIPLTDASGAVRGSLALFRFSLEEEMSRIYHSSESAASAFYSVINEVCKVVPATLVTATRFSSDLGHFQPFFIFRPKRTRKRVISRKLWQALPKSLLPETRNPDTILTQGLTEVLKGEKLQELRQTEFFQDVIDAKVDVVVRRPIFRENRLIGSIAFYSPSEHGLTAVDVERVRNLPLQSAVMSAIDYFDSRRRDERFELLRDVGRCPSIEEVYELVLRRVCHIFGWSHASILRVDHARKKIRLVAHFRAQGKGHFQLDPGNEQQIDKGVLGETVKTGQSQVVRDAHLDRTYAKSAVTPDARSELSIPIRLEDERKARWILDVEDKRVDAFSSDERNWLEEVAREIGGYMRRLSEANFLFKCFDSSSDATVVTDWNHEIRRANAAAARLFGASSPKELKGPLASLFVSKSEAEEAEAELPKADSEFMVSIRSEDGASGSVRTYVSKTMLPESIGGAIYTFKDVQKIRTSVQREVVQDVSYEVGLEARTPLAIAQLGLNKLRDKLRDDQRGIFDQATKYLRQANSALAKFSAMKAGDYLDQKPLDKWSVNIVREVEAIVRDLPRDALVKFMMDGGADSIANVMVNAIQVRLGLESLLGFLLAHAPEERPVEIRIRQVSRGVRLQLDGAAVRAARGSRAEGMLRLSSEIGMARDAIERLLNSNGCDIRQIRRADRLRFVILFKELAVDSVATRMPLPYVSWVSKAAASIRQSLSENWSLKSASEDREKK